MLVALADLHLRYDRDLLAAVSSRSGLKAMDLIGKAVAVSLSGELVSEGSPTALIQWFVDQGQGLYGAVGESAWTYTGHRDRFSRATADRVQVTAPAFAALAETPWTEMASGGQHEDTDHGLWPVRERGHGLLSGPQDRGPQLGKGPGSDRGRDRPDSPYRGQLAMPGPWPGWAAPDGCPYRPQQARLTYCRNTRPCGIC